MKTVHESCAMTELEISQKLALIHRRKLTFLCLAAMHGGHVKL